MPVDDSILDSNVTVAFFSLIHSSYSRNSLNRGYVKKLTATADDSQNPRICGWRTNSVELDRPPRACFHSHTIHRVSTVGTGTGEQERNVLHKLNLTFIYLSKWFGVLGLASGWHL